MARIIFETTNHIQLIANVERRRYQVIVNGELVAEAAVLALGEAEYVRLGGVLSAPVVLTKAQERVRRRQGRFR